MNDAPNRLPEPDAVEYPDSGFRKDADALAIWAAHMYDTGGEPYWSADSMHSHCAYWREMWRAANARAEGLERTLNAAAVHLASIGHPVDAKGNYCKGGEWTFAEAVPMTANEIEVKAAFLLINSALSGLRPIDAAQAVRSEASEGGKGNGE